MSQVTEEDEHSNPFVAAASHVTEEEETSSPLVRAMIEKLEALTQSPDHIQDEPYCTIYRVPPNIRETDPKSYAPQILSIGPYHHGNPSLQPMEEHKWRYLHKLLARNPQLDRADALEVCVEKVRGSEAWVRGCYSTHVALGRDDFATMMVLDGCFVLELCLTFYDGEWDVDPIYTVPWMMPLIWCDLFKLENQIPFFVLEDLFSVVAGPLVTDLSLRELVFTCLMMSRAEAHSFALEISAETSATLTGDRLIYHLLHFYSLVLRPSDGNTDTSRPSSAQSVLRRVNPFIPGACILPMSDRFRSTEGHRIPCLVELVEAGIKIRRKPDPNTLLDVTFRDGMLDIPSMFFDDSAGIVIRNLIAFEQCCPSAGDHFTTYRLFLDCILDSAKDVAILKQGGILRNTLRSDEEAVIFVKQIGREVAVRSREHYLAKLFKEVNEHCESVWGKKRAMLKRKYFRNPWAGISVVAATALLVMTLVQVIFAILSYHT